jgi:O-antigen ligase
MASLFVFPFIFSFFSKQNGFLLIQKIKISNRFLVYYILAVLLLNLIFFSIFWIGEFNLFDTSKHYAYLIDNKLGKYNIHSIYMSMHLCVSIIFALITIIKSTNKKVNLLYIIVILLLLFFLLVLNKKGPILSLIAVISLYVLYRGNRTMRSVFIGSLVLLTLIISINTKSRNQFKELFKINDIAQSTATSTNIRYTIYKNALQAFKKQPLFGYGIGDSKNELLKVHKKNSLLLYENEYNTHNQYLSFLLSVGVIGLILISFSLFNLLRKGIKQANFLFLGIFIFYLIEMFSENILERENGVIFYSFFISLFQILKKEDNIL